MFKKPFLPTINDINNKEIKKLAQRLKGKSDKETLTNILEWQERNIQAWIDRWYMFLPLYFLFIISLFLLPVEYSVKTIFIAFFIVLAFFDIAFALSYILPIMGFLIVFFTFLFSAGFPPINKFFTIYHLVVLSITFGSIISLIIYLLLKYRSIKSFQPEFKVSDTFKLSLPVNKILKYRLAICRDYAKLTASLLLNLYKNRDIYFILIPQHVAVGIQLNEKLYVLDQRLPVFTFDNWLMFWKEKFKKKKLKANVLKIIRKNGKIEIEKLKSEKINKSKTCKRDVKTLANKVVNILEIEEGTRGHKADLEIPLRYYALYCDNDEIVEFSLIKAIKNKLENEFCGDLSKISKVEITQHAKDFILSVWMK